MIGLAIPFPAAISTRMATMMSSSALGMLIQQAALMPAETYVIFGSAAPSASVDLNSTSVDMIIYGNYVGDHSGWSVSSGDINGDGYDDVIISAPYADPAYRSYAGETYIIFGSSAPPAIVDLNSIAANMTIYGDDYYDCSGSSVSSGDINADGYDDVIIGAPEAAPAGGTAAGETYVILGSSAPPATIDLNSTSADMIIYGDDAYDYSGWSVSSGDINGDGYDDVIIGAWYADPAGGSKAGETYIIFGSVAPPSTIDLNSVSADMTIYGDDASDGSGFSLSSGDINGDGYDDVIIGALFADPAGGTSAGETYVILGSAAPPAIIDLNSISADMTICGDDADDWSGTSVSSGDINGDSYDDVIIGAPNASPSGGILAGETYVIFGSSVPLYCDFSTTDISNWVYAGNGNVSVKGGQQYQVKIEVRESQIKVFVDDQCKIDVVPDEKPLWGKIILEYRGAGTCLFDDLIIN